MESDKAKLEEPFQPYTFINSKEWNWATYITYMPLNAIQEGLFKSIGSNDFNDFKKLYSKNAYAFDSYSKNKNNLNFYFDSNGICNSVTLFDTTMTTLDFGTSMPITDSNHRYMFESGNLVYKSDDKTIKFPNATTTLQTRELIQDELNKFYSNSNSNIELEVLYNSNTTYACTTALQNYGNVYYAFPFNMNGNTYLPQQQVFSTSHKKAPIFIMPCMILTLGDKSNLRCDWYVYYYGNPNGVASTNTYKPFTFIVVNSTYNNGQLTIDFTLPPLVFYEPNANSTEGVTKESDTISVKFLCGYESDN